MIALPGPWAGIEQAPGGEGRAVRPAPVGHRDVVDESWATRGELRAAIVHWIERTYHRRRWQDRLGRSTSIELESIMTDEAIQAA